MPIAITMGDGAGIGPEIIMLAATSGRLLAPFFVVGSAAVMARARSITGGPEIRRIDRPGELAAMPGTLAVIDCAQGLPSPEFGEVNAEAGRVAYAAILHAIGLAMERQVSAIVTAPVHKEALAAAGVKFPGHTEILADRAGTSDVVMMMANADIRTVLVTIHMSLTEAIRQGNHDAQMRAIRLAHQGCVELGIAEPRVAVAGLNPHAGEGGLFGREEIEIIAPAIATSRKDGINVSGPWPGDTVFAAARRGHFDVVVAQYHDQGLIPVKYLGVETGVNITLGLPFVRTSPDHGTAFDIAGTGRANPDSLITAFEYAVRLARTRQQGDRPHVT